MPKKMLLLMDVLMDYSKAAIKRRSTVPLELPVYECLKDLKICFLYTHLDKLHCGIPTSTVNRSKSMFAINMYSELRFCTSSVPS